MEELKIVKDLVKFDTIKDKQNKEIINYIEEYLKKLGFKTEYKTKCLVMSIGKNPKLGFLGHTDTVEYIEEFKNPFELTLKDNYLYGLGACDMKGGIAAMLETVSKIDFSKLKNGMKLYFTYDEEIGFEGIYELVNNNEKFPEVMIFGEPTNNKFQIGSKGLLEYELEFKGINAHSSNPEKGKSANLNAIRFLSNLNVFYEKKIKNFNNNYYKTPYTTMNVGVIKGGNGANSISDNCYAAIDFRVVEKEHIDIIKEEVKKLSVKYEFIASIKNEIEPFINKIDIIEKDIGTSDFVTEASLIKECKKIILGPGPVTAHETNEYITEESYNKLVKQYKDLIQGICNK